MTGGSPIRIARRSELPSFEEIRAATLDEILRALAQREIAQPVFADLSLGAWRSHELARSVFGQLQIAWPLGNTDRSLAVAARFEHEQVIGDWIDSEGRGDASQRNGVLLAETLFGAIGARPLQLVLLTPRFSLGWRAEDTAFLHYLAHGVRSQDRIVLVNGSQASAQAPMLAPGVIDPDTARALGSEGHALAGGWLLIPPERRGDPRATSALEFDRLAAGAVQPWLRAFAHVYGNSYFVDPWFLCAEAMQQLADGGCGIALQLMERAVACAQSPEDRASLRALLQGFQIALMRYDEAAQAPDPSRALSPLQRGALMMTKGWGLVMMKQAERAEPYMQGARELLEPVLGHNRQFLYLLNISALNRVNLGDMDGALAIEKTIECWAAEAGGTDYQLQYVNSINLARLYRRRNDFDLSFAYYQRAFATTDGARTESDLIYTNACLARLDSARGRHFEALLGWLRASLHWLSSDSPEALGWRVLSALCGARIQPGETVALEDVARSLHELLTASGAQAGITQLDGEATPAFLRTDRFSDISSARAIGAEGFSVFMIDAPAPVAQDGAHYKSLAASVTGLLSFLAQASEVSPGPTILVDDGLGREMASTKSELLSTCLRLGVKHAQYRGEEMDLTLLRPSRAALGPAVADVDFSRADAVVRFKRYLPARRLSSAETDVLRQLDKPTDEMLATIRALEADRVVTLSLDLP